MSAVLVTVAGWLSKHIFEITTAVFGAYSFYRLWDDRRPRIATSAVLDGDEWSMPRVRIFNLGKAPVIVEELRVILRDPEEDPFSSALSQQLNPGANTIDLELPTEVFDKIILAADLEASVRYRSPTGRSRWTEPLAFNLVGSRPRFMLRQHFARTRDVNCPKCDVRALVDVTGTKTEREVLARCKKFEKELRSKCPGHDPILMLREQRAKLKG
jgi:hypothetical protein